MNAWLLFWSLLGALLVGVAIGAYLVCWLLDRALRQITP